MLLKNMNHLIWGQGNMDYQPLWAAGTSSSVPTAMFDCVLGDLAVDQHGERLPGSLKAPKANAHAEDDAEG